MAKKQICVHIDEKDFKEMKEIERETGLFVSIQIETKLKGYNITKIGDNITKTSDNIKDESVLEHSKGVVYVNNEYECTEKSDVKCPLTRCMYYVNKDKDFYQCPFLRLKKVHSIKK